MSLEKYLKGEPLNEAMASLMAGEDEEQQAESQLPRNFADGTEITDQDREYLRLLMLQPGWQVLLKLLDTSLKAQEDAARQASLQSPRAPETIELWCDVAADKKARNRLVALAEVEVEALKAKQKEKKRKNGRTLGR